MAQLLFTASNEKELTVLLIKIFSKKYDKTIGKEIADNLIIWYAEQEMGWNDITEDFECQQIDDCLGIDDIIETLRIHNIDIKDNNKEKNEIHKLLKQCNLINKTPINTPEPPPIEPANSDNVTMNDLKDKIYKGFNKKYGNDKSAKALQAFNEIIDDDDVKCIYIYI